ncbi:MAG: DUF998 domain-containing protein [Nakamurella sp.]
MPPTAELRSATLPATAVAPVALIGGGEWAAAVQPDGYSRVRDSISTLAAQGAAHRWIMTTALAVVGMSYLMTAFRLTGAHRTGRWLLGVGGAATLVVAASPQPHPLHVPAAGIAFVALALWPVASGLPSRWTASAVTVVTAVLLGWFALQLGGSLLGATERAVAWTEACWPVACVVLTRAQRAVRPPAHG